MHKINRVVLVVTCVVLAVAQSTILNTIKIGRIKPDLLLIAVIFFSLNEGAVLGLFSGMLCGFLTDVLSGGIFGLSIFTLGMLGLFIGAYRNKLYSESLLIQVTLTFAIAIIGQAFYHFVLNLFLKTQSLREYLVYLIMPYAVYTAAVSPILFFILSKLSPEPKYRQI